MVAWIARGALVGDMERLEVIAVPIAKSMTATATTGETMVAVAIAGSEVAANSAPHTGQVVTATAGRMVAITATMVEANSVPHTVHQVGVAATSCGTS